MDRSQHTESVWDYPRPPALERCLREVRVELAGTVLARSDSAWRVLETSHAPTIYVPPADVRMDLLAPSAVRQTFCEFKGGARYLDAHIGDTHVEAVAWFYPSPTPGYEQLAGHVSFYPGRVDAAWLGDERAQAQEGDFYGGWITAEIVGPFKGGPGTWSW